MSAPATTSRQKTPQEAAVDWFLRASDGPLPPADTEAFAAWLEAGAENRDAYGAVEALWSASGELEDYPRFDEKRRWAIRSADFARRTRRAVVVAIAVAVVGAGGLGLYMDMGPRSLATQSFRTAVGQQATVSLPDGSVVTLNTDTVVRTRADHERRLVYLDKGQAFFKVAKNRRHPFVVTAAGRTVTALGTAFDVRVDGDVLKVVLVEGKVRVEAIESPPAPPRPTPAADAPPAMPPPVTQSTDLSAGSQLVALDDADWRLTRANVARETSWLRGQIVFDDVALGDVVAELNRYSKRKIVIADPDLEKVRLSGIYTPGNIKGFSEALWGAGVAQVDSESDREVRIVGLDKKISAAR